MMWIKALPWAIAALMAFAAAFCLYLYQSERDAFVAFRAEVRAIGEAQQVDLLKHLAYRHEYRAGEDEGRAFFKLMREHTLMGFYTSKIGLEQLDYPGLRSFYAELPGCPHPGDPEHRHLAGKG